MGRPSKYNPEQHPLICEMLARNGFTQKKIAKELGVSYSTFKTWKSEYPALGGAISKGRQFVTARAEDKLLDKVLGRERMTEQTIRSEPVFDKDGNPKKDKDGKQIKKQVKTVKSHMVLSDLGAIKFWLINTAPEKWRERIEVTAEVTARPIHELTDAELEAELAKFGDVEEAEYVLLEDKL